MVRAVSTRPTQEDCVKRRRAVLVAVIAVVATAATVGSILYSTRSAGPGPTCETNLHVPIPNVPECLLARAGWEPVSTLDNTGPDNPLLAVVGALAGGDTSTTNAVRVQRTVQKRYGAGFTATRLRIWVYPGVSGVTAYTAPTVPDTGSVHDSELLFLRILAPDGSLAAYLTVANVAPANLVKLCQRVAGQIFAPGQFIDLDGASGWVGVPSP